MTEGWRVVGIDALTDYYDVRLKQARLDTLLADPKFTFVEKRIEETDVMLQLFEAHKPDAVVHLAAQAGVRYSIENPRSYLQSNIVGTFEILEAARTHPPEHMLATKKATENMAHSYAHLYALPITMLRFFTIYGPWGRPDMAPMKFAKAILSGEPIDIYNNGEMKRDFTYIDDLVEAMFRIFRAPPPGSAPESVVEGDNLSPVAPFRVLNIGTSSPVDLMDFITALEDAAGTPATKNFMEMQSGDVVATTQHPSRAGAG